MTLGMTRTLPRWLIDDTSDIANARIFCVHTQQPRLIGELLPEEEEAGLEGLEISGLPDGQVLTHVQMFEDGPITQDLIESLARAIRHHHDVRS